MSTPSTFTSHDPFGLAATSLPTPAASSGGVEEHSAMEAVRELLFGRRMSELHTRLGAAEEHWGQSLSSSEIRQQERIMQMERKHVQSEQEALSREASLRVELAQAHQAMAQRDRELQNEINLLREEMFRLAELHQNALAATQSQWQAEANHWRGIEAHLGQLSGVFGQFQAHVSAAPYSAPSAPVAPPPVLQPTAATAFIVAPDPAPIMLDHDRLGVTASIPDPGMVVDEALAAMHSRREIAAGSVALSAQD
jgi:hypothetical protein